jgi:hypothetical protein
VLLARLQIVLGEAEAAEVNKRFGDKQRKGKIDWLRLYDSLDIEPPQDYHDPESVADALPQPYRMINKLLGGIVDEAWSTLKRRAAAPGLSQHRQTMTAVQRVWEWDGQVPGVPGESHAPQPVLSQTPTALCTH